MLREKFEILMDDKKDIERICEVLFDDDADDEDDDNEEKTRVVYQVIEDLKHHDEDTVLANLKAQRYGWNHDSLKKYQDIEYEQDCFIIQPFEIVEGIVECKCGSKRVYSYSKQTRSGDESISTFNECLICKNKWMYSG